MTFTPEREATIRKECVGRAMVNAHYLYELFAEIKMLETEKKILGMLLVRQANNARNDDDDIGAHRV